MKPGENGTPNISSYAKTARLVQSHHLTASVVRILDKKVDSDEDDEVGGEKRNERVCHSHSGGGNSDHRFVSDYFSEAMKCADLNTD